MDLGYVVTTHHVQEIICIDLHSQTVLGPYMDAVKNENDLGLSVYNFPVISPSRFDGAARSTRDTGG